VCTKNQSMREKAKINSAENMERNHQKDESKQKDNLMGVYGTYKRGKDTSSCITKRGGKEDWTPVKYSG